MFKSVNLNTCEFLLLEHIGVCLHTVSFTKYLRLLIKVHTLQLYFFKDQYKGKYT